jgi:50S ribosomal protein L16 3-hydroxylase
VNKLGDDLTPQDFLKEYWQKKPCLIRNALPGFVPPIDGNDLAGLACEEMAESRLVRGSFAEQNWQLDHGPFSEDAFAGLPENDWTLLVQDVEKHYPPLQELMRMFSFLPTWRLDDLMVSYAVTGGSVGPHVDQYDVFLYQAQGQRLWQINDKFNPALLEHCPLNVLREFEPGQEWIVKAGDMLYLPPNIAHHGIALNEGMTWSIGLRAPSAADLLMSLGESLARDHAEGGRYSDPDLEIPARAGEIDEQAVERMKKLLNDQLEDPAAFKEFLGAFITRFRLAQEPASPDPDLNTAVLLQKLQSGYQLSRNPWTRLAWVESGATARLFAAGSRISCTIPTALELCSNPEPELFSTALNELDMAALIQLINGGHLVLFREDDI